MNDVLLGVLLTGKVEFVIVGGVAAVLHGSTVVTRDLDICVPTGAPSFLAIQKALAPLNPRVRAGKGYIPLHLDETKAAALKNLYITTDEGRLDCLGQIAGVGDFLAVASASDVIDIGGRACRVLSVDGLISAKEAMGRDRDRLVIEQLQALRERRRD